MTKITIDVGTKDIIECIDTADLVEAITEDIQDNNPEWWTKKVCEPLLKVIKETITRNDNDLIRDVIREVIDEIVFEVGLDNLVIKTVEDIVKDSTKDKIDKLLTNLYK